MRIYGKYLIPKQITHLGQYRDITQGPLTRPERKGEARTSQTKTQQQPEGLQLGERRQVGEGQVMGVTGGPKV